MGFKDKPIDRTAKIDASLEAAIRARVRDGHLPCAAAFLIAEETGATRAEVGRAAAGVRVARAVAPAVRAAAAADRAAAAARPAARVDPRASVARMPMVLPPMARRVHRAMATPRRVRRVIRTHRRARPVIPMHRRAPRAIGPGASVVRVAKVPRLPR